MYRLRKASQCIQVRTGAQWRTYGYIHVPKKKPPHVLGPAYLWRKCFVVHPSIQTLDATVKSQWLTRTCIVDGLPDRQTSSIDDSLIDEFQCRVSQTLAYQERDKPNWQLKRHELASGVLQSALTSLWTLGHPHLRESSLTFDPKIECYWRNMGDSYLCFAHPLYILHTAKPLELFLPPDTVLGEHPPLFKYKPRHLGLFQRSFNQIVPFGGCKMYSPFSFPHTVIAEDRNSRGNRDQLIAHGLLQLFAQTAGQMVQYGFPVDEDLIYPLAAQGVITNGRDFTFLCFQLNTLDMSEQGNRSNILWTGPTLRLYERVSLGQGLEGFNPECARTLLEVLCLEPTRDRPVESGFTLRLRAKREAIKQQDERRRQFREAELMRAKQQTNN